MMSGISAPPSGSVIDKIFTDIMTREFPEFVRLAPISTDVTIGAAAGLADLAGPLAVIVAAAGLIGFSVLKVASIARAISQLADGLWQLQFVTRSGFEQAYYAVKNSINLAAWSIDQVSVGVYWILHTIIPGLRDSVRQSGAAALRTATSYAYSNDTWLRGAIEWTQRQLSRMLDDAVNRLTGAIEWTQRALQNNINRLSVSLNSKIDSTRKQLADQIASSDARLRQLIQATSVSDRAYADTQASAAYTAAVGEVTHELVQPIAKDWPNMRQDMVDTAVVAQTNFPDIADELHRLAGMSPAALPFATVLMSSMMRLFLRTARDCVIPNCENLSQFGRDLVSLSDLLGDTFWLAFLTALYADPVDTAKLVDDALSPIVSGVVTGVREITGVR